MNLVQPLRRTFGAEYETYCTNAGRWIPHWVCPLALTITRRGRLVPAIDGLSYESEQGMR